MKLQDLCLEKLCLITPVPITSFMFFSKVSFMDSAGIGLLIGRYKLAKLLGGTTKIVNSSRAVKKMLEMSGVVRIIPVEEDEKVG